MDEAVKSFPPSHRANQNEMARTIQYYYNVYLNKQYLAHTYLVSKFDIKCYSEKHISISLGFPHFGFNCLPLMRWRTFPFHGQYVHYCRVSGHQAKLLPMHHIYSGCSILVLHSTFFLSLGRNNAVARKTGLPIVVSIIDPIHALWVLTKTLLLPLLALLPGDAEVNSRLDAFGWQFKAKYTVHERLGRILIPVNPSFNIINMADHEVCHEAMQDVEAFQKPRKIYGNCLFPRRMLA